MSHHLDSLLSESNVIRVNEDGTVSDVEPNVYGPDVYVTYDDDGKEHVTCEGNWDMERGWTQQYLYNGPMMHPSEYVGGKIADHILETPGLWCVVVPYDLDSGDLAEGWVLCHRPE